MEGASSSFPGGGGTSSGGGGSLVILSVSIVGILSTALLLLACYLFLTRCGLLFFWRWRADADQSSSISVVGALHNQEPPRRSRGGLEEAAIRRIPTFRYHQAHLVVVECAVCLGDFCDGERLRLLPPCRHAFHIDCIDAWLHATGSCPLCRAPVVVAADDHPAAAIVGLPHATDGDIVIDITAADEAAAAAAAAEQPPSNDRSRLLMPLRRSLSMDSSTDKQRFYLALHRIIQQQQQEAAAGGKEQGESAAADRSSRRLRRSFFSFSQSRGSRTAILPL